MTQIKIGDRVICQELDLSGCVADLFGYGDSTAVVVEIDQPAVGRWLAAPIEALSPVTLQ